jgi:hypothetical protein
MKYTRKENVAIWAADQRKYVKPNVEVPLRRILGDGIWRHIPVGIERRQFGRAFYDQHITLGFRFIRKIDGVCHYTLR